MCFMHMIAKYLLCVGEYDGTIHLRCVNDVLSSMVVSMMDRYDKRAKRCTHTFMYSAIKWKC